MKFFKKAVFLFITLFLIWILLTGLHPQELIIGAIVALIIMLIFLGSAEIFAEIKLTPKAFVFWLIYIFVFLWELIKSNLDVAFRVLNPKLPINPGIVKVKTNLKSKIGRIILANSITLTPGTLTVETKDDFFYIHWIDISSTDIEGATNAIVAKFEKYLEVIFG
ncbi:MAG: Na+/H+ antiporter subunit E [Candidatus Cloacimonetes bacterium]|nr:Na+/H+ antiporter subunit E [Candidatus Cloacimonadota bacterium]MCF7813510.1 Na+/H+ antiporter subunit E [Candidatus Cloacimonadota bacterium]MCF7868706.1 Na+/H+ antiporter subunit E [Candidatus Cloacimonadota bacterium]MCF7884672.1 Na+/H+ antiporter subunit E [Candidatus Cloacimonadota bacterium]